MKRFFALVITLLMCFATCTAVAACDKTVKIDEISIVEPESLVFMSGETFTLEYTTVPKRAAKKVEVDWETSDENKLSYADGEFTANICGKVTVKVTAHGRDNDVSDEITLRVKAPEGFEESSGRGYQLVYPSEWEWSRQGDIQTWTASNDTTNMNITTEALNKNYLTATAYTFKSTIEAIYGLLGITVSFTKPVKVTKENYLGVDRVRVDYQYSFKILGKTTKLHQTQMIFNNDDVKLSCVLTVTYRAEDFDEKAEQLQETIFSQFIPA